MDEVRCKSLLPIAIGIVVNRKILVPKNSWWWLRPIIRESMTIHYFAPPGHDVHDFIFLFHGLHMWIRISRPAGAVKRVAAKGLKPIIHLHNMNHGLKPWQWKKSKALISIPRLPYSLFMIRYYSFLYLLSHSFLSNCLILPSIAVSKARHLASYFAAAPKWRK